MLAEGCNRVIADSGIPAHTVDLGAKGCVSYRAEPLTNYRDFLETNPELYYASYPYMVNRGIFMTPGDEEQWTISVQHTEADSRDLRRARSASSARSWPARGSAERHMHRYTEDTDDAVAGHRGVRPQPHREPPAAGRPATAGSSTRAPARPSRPRVWAATRRSAIWAEVLAPATISTDHPASMAFVPGAPTKASVLFDLVVGASSTIAAGWIDGAGAIWAENQALRWVADLAGFPAEAGGVFVSGGSAGNLSALVAARHAATTRRGERPPMGGGSRPADSVHSIDRHRSARDGRRHPRRPRATNAGGSRAPPCAPRSTPTAATGIFAVVASAGATNAGTVDDLAGSPTCAPSVGCGSTWTAPTAAPACWRPRGRALLRRHRARRLVHRRPAQVAVRALRRCALLYRAPGALARAPLRQEAALPGHSTKQGAEWTNGTPRTTPITCRDGPAGCRCWFSLATYGTDAYRDAVERVLTLTRRAAAEVAAAPGPGADHGAGALRGPVPAHRTGSPTTTRRWWRRLLDAQIAFVQPTSWDGEKVARLCFVNPRYHDRARAGRARARWPDRARCRRDRRAGASPRARGTADRRRDARGPRRRRRSWP